MSGTSFPFPFSSPFGDAGFVFVPVFTRAEQLGQTDSSLIGKDRMIDPVTRDYVRTANGQWAETADSRTKVFIALSIELGASPFDPEQGTQIPERLRSGIGMTPDFLQAETVRVFEDLRRESVLTDQTIAVRDSDGKPLTDVTGRLSCRTQWADLASGRPVESTFTPR